MEDNKEPGGSATGDVQVYRVPAGIILPAIVTGSTLMLPSLQITRVIPLILAKGKTPSVSVNPEEVHPPAATTGVIK